MEHLTQWLDETSVQSAKSLIGPCTREILEMVAILIDLEITTRDHAADLAADGWMFRTEEAIERADKYRESINALVEVWGKPDCDEE